MDSALAAMIEKLHAFPDKCVLALTGGAATAPAWLLSVPGGSRTVLEVIVPYGDRSLTEFLGRRAEQSCSEATSLEMARRAYDRAAWLAPGERVAGVGCTASLATDRPKRGDHRLHVSVQLFDCCRTYSLTLTKGARNREEEETLAGRMVLNALASAWELPDRLGLALRSEEAIREETHMPAFALPAFFRSEVEAVAVLADGQSTSAAPRPLAVFPGAFNPAHAGHWGLAAVAQRLLHLPVAFELSVRNVDKPELPLDEVQRRLGQFQWLADLWITRAPTFVEKSALFPGATFLVGADTAERIVSPRYYADRAELRDAAFAQFQARKCRFLVAARKDSAGRLITLENLALPEPFCELFAAIPTDDFQLDVSSTAIRSQSRT